MAAVYSLCDKNTFLPKLEKLSCNTEGEKKFSIKKYLTLSYAVLILCLGLFYYLHDTQISDLIMPLLYAVWNQLSMLAPPSFYALYRLQKGLPPLQMTAVRSMILTGSIILGWVVILYGSWQSGVTGDYAYSHITYFMSIGIAILGVWGTIKCPVKLVNTSEVYS